MVNGSGLTKETEMKSAHKGLRTIKNLDLKEVSDRLDNDDNKMIEFISEMISGKVTSHEIVHQILDDYGLV